MNSEVYKNLLGLIYNNCSVAISDFVPGAKVDVGILAIDFLFNLTETLSVWC